MKITIKNIVTIFFVCIFAVSIVVVGTSIVSKASEPWSIYGGYSNHSAYVNMYQYTGTVRHCVLRLDQSNSNNYVSYAVVSSETKTVSSGDFVSTGGTITNAHARGVGYIYKGSVPNSLLDKQLITYVK